MFPEQFYLETGHAAHIGLTNSTQRTDQLMKTLTKLKSDISVTYVGWTYSENILTGLGTLLWLLSILFFPIYSLGMARLVSSASSQQAGQISTRMWSRIRSDWLPIEKNMDKYIIATTALVADGVGTPTYQIHRLIAPGKGYALLGGAVAPMTPWERETIKNNWPLKQENALKMRDRLLEKDRAADG